MRTLEELGLSADERNLLLRGVHEGRYNLLLGAGSSYGCVGGDNVELKDGATLSVQISDEFNLGLNADEAKKLPITYEEALSEEPGRFKSWLRNRFIGCTPTWQSLIFRAHWERIWTFNIDDVLDNAFATGGVSNAALEIQPLDSIASHLHCKSYIYMAEPQKSENPIKDSFSRSLNMRGQLRAFRLGTPVFKRII
jgi:hypothetical protein